MEDSSDDEISDNICAKIIFTKKGRLAYYCVFCRQYGNYELFTNHLSQQCEEFEEYKLKEHMNEWTFDTFQTESKSFKHSFKQTDFNNHTTPIKLKKLAQKNYIETLSLDRDTENIFHELHDAEPTQLKYGEQNVHEYISIERLDDESDLEDNEQVENESKNQLEPVLEKDVLKAEEDAQDNYILEQNDETNEIEPKPQLHKSTTHKTPEEVHNFATFILKTQEDNQNDYELQPIELINDEAKTSICSIESNEALKRNCSSESIDSKSFTDEHVDTPSKVRNVRERKNYFPSHITSDERKYQCRVCGLAFKDSANMNYHLRRHNNNKKSFSCPDCDKKFFTSYEVKSHSRVHNKLAKNFLCTQCGLAYESNSRLLSHQKRHANQRDYLCKICDKGFFSFKALKRHLASHSTARPYTCELCAATFKLPGNLRAHMKQHENKREYKCNLCDAAFNVQAGLFGHIKSKHKNKIKA